MRQHGRRGLLKRAWFAAELGGNQRLLDWLILDLGDGHLTVQPHEVRAFTCQLKTSWMFPVRSQFQEWFPLTISHSFLLRFYFNWFPCSILNLTFLRLSKMSWNHVRSRHWEVVGVERPAVKLKWKWQNHWKSGLNSNACCKCGRVIRVLSEAVALLGDFPSSDLAGVAQDLEICCLRNREVPFHSAKCWLLVSSWTRNAGCIQIRIGCMSCMC